MVQTFLSQFSGGMYLYSALVFLYETSFFWLPLILIVILWDIWLNYIQAIFIAKQKPTLLEIRLPKELMKSPAAMEVIFSALHLKGASKNFIEAFWDGKVPPWFSFEMVSIEGQVKFFIWTWARWKNFIETQIYAQYPTVEIYEVSDYTLSVTHDSVNNDYKESAPFWATHFVKSKKGGTASDVFPIKTYLDYGLDQDPKEEFKIEPMSGLLEYLGNLKKGEQAWIQILVQAHMGRGLMEGKLFKTSDWSAFGQKAIEDIREKSRLKNDSGIAGFPMPTPGQVDTVKAVERQMSKYPFETMIRGFYIAAPGSFNPGNISGLIGTFRHFSSSGGQGFKLAKFTDFDQPWEDFRRVRRNTLERKMLEAYKMRSFFWPPYKNYRVRPFILTTEELATIYHFPGSVAATPTMPRITAKKADSPSNLPI